MLVCEEGGEDVASMRGRRLCYKALPWREGGRRLCVNLNREVSSVWAPDCFERIQFVGKRPTRCTGLPVVSGLCDIIRGGYREEGEEELLKIT